jgi:hypothetical protein
LLHAVVVAADRVGPLLCARPLQELLGRLVEADVASLPTDPGLPLQDRRALQLGEVDGDLTLDPLPEPLDVSAAVIRQSRYQLVPRW